MAEKLNPTEGNLDQNFWLWVTRPQYFLQPDLESGGEWTCHKDTRRGDLALLWRTKPRSDIAYLFQAKCDAYATNDRYSRERGWTYGCEYRSIFTFSKPVSIAEIKQDAHLEDWNALRATFQGKVFRFERAIWDRVNRLLIEKNPGYKAKLKQVSGVVSSKILSEEKLEQRLADNLEILRPDYDLELWQDPKTGEPGRQYFCKGHGRIDLLCFDRKRHCFVVIELKNVRAGVMTFAQICDYMQYVKDQLSGGRSAKGLVISRGYDARFEAMKRGSKYPIQQIDLEDLGFK